MKGFFADFSAFLRHVPAMVTDGHANLKGRTYLFISGILVVAVGFSTLLAGGIDTWKENSQRVGNQMLTSAQATDADMFDYLIDTSAGRTFAQGDVSTEEHCVTLPGAEYRGCFAAVRERREVYETRTEYYECGTEKNPRTCSRQVSEWVDRGGKENEAAYANLLGVDLPYDFVRNDLRDVNVSEVREPSAGGWFRDNDRYFYVHDEERLSYQVAENNYAGTIWLNLGLEGQIDKLGGFWEGKVIDQVVEEHTKEPVGAVVTQWLVQVLIILLALTGIIILLVRDVEDGHDHNF